MLKNRPGWLILLILQLCCLIAECISPEDNPNILDKFVRVFWDPSGLVRFWVAVDQFRNIASSWRGVAHHLVTLPIQEARGGRSHITIKGYDDATGRIKSTSSSHLERFAKIYTNSHLPGEKEILPEHHWSNQNIFFVSLPLNSYTGSNVQRNHFPQYKGSWGPKPYDDELRSEFKNPYHNTNLQPNSLNPLQFPGPERTFPGYVFKKRQDFSGALHAILLNSDWPRTIDNAKYSSPFSAGPGDQSKDENASPTVASHGGNNRFNKNSKLRNLDNAAQSDHTLISSNYKSKHTSAH